MVKIIHDSVHAIMRRDIEHNTFKKFMMEGGPFKNTNMDKI
jgi:hypothetical protein